MPVSLPFTGSRYVVTSVRKRKMVIFKTTLNV